jgi:hypothetical protein
VADDELRQRTHDDGRGTTGDHRAGGRGHRSENACHGKPGNRYARAEAVPNRDGLVHARQQTRDVKGLGRSGAGYAGDRGSEPAHAHRAERNGVNPLRGLRTVGVARPVRPAP